MTLIGIPREIHPGEKRVAATPQTILKLKKLGFDVAVESGAGEAINATDAEYQEAGAAIIGDAAELWATSDVVMKVRPPEDNEPELIREGGWLVGFIWPGQNREIVDRLAKKHATVFAMDSVPRITRAQKMDTLSAMANIAGYRAVVEAAAHFPRFFYRTNNGSRSYRSCKSFGDRSWRRRFVGYRSCQRSGRDRACIRPSIGYKRSGCIDGRRVSRAES